MEKDAGMRPIKANLNHLQQNRSQYLKVLGQSWGATLALVQLYPHICRLCRRCT